MISRNSGQANRPDTATANDGALTQEFDAAKRADVQQGFAAAKALTQQTAMFFANRAAEEQAKKDEATRKEAELAQGIRLGADLKPLLDSNNNRIALTDAERALYNGDAKTEGSVAYLNAQAKSLNDTFGAGSPARILATALNGAAGSNTAGSLGALAQSAAVNVLQSLAVSEVKNIADGFANRDPFGNVTETAQSEAVRSALQAVVGCAGAATGGSGDCTSGAIGAAASVVFNNVLNAIDEPRAIGPDGREVPQSTKEAQARTNLVATFVAALANGAGVDSAAATNAATIETENNRNVVSDGKTLIRTVSRPGTTQEQFLASVAEFRRAAPDEYSQALALFGGNEDDLINYLAQPNGQNIKDAGAASVARSDAAQRSGANPVTGGQITVNFSAHMKIVRANYDLANGPGAYDALIATGKAQDAAIQVQVEAAQAQAQREMACLALCVPTVVAGAIFTPIAVEAAGAYAVASTGLAGTSALVVKGGVGGTASLAYTEATTQAFAGRAPTTGERIGSFTTGAIFAPGVYGVTRFSAPVNGMINGGVANGLSNVFGQVIDLKLDGQSLSDLNKMQFGTSTLIGAAAGGLGGTVPSYFGRTPSLGNSQSIVAGARVGWRVQVNEAPATSVTIMTQAHLDALNAVVDPPKPIAPPPVPKSKCLTDKGCKK